MGNLIRITDASGRTTSRRSYDHLNRLIRAEDGNGNFYEYEYDAVGNQVAVTDPQGLHRHAYGLNNPLSPAG